MNIYDYIEQNQPLTKDQLLSGLGENALKKASQDKRIIVRNGRYRIKGTTNRDLLRMIALRLARPVTINELVELTGVSRNTCNTEARRVLNMVGKSRLHGSKVCFYSLEEPKKPEGIKEEVKGISHTLKMRTDQSIGIQYHTRFQFI
jgi:hypothetical protein